MEEPNDADVVGTKDSIRVFLDETRGLLAVELFPPPDRSQVAAELASRPRHEEHLRTSYGQGLFLLESAADHLRAFAKTLDEPVETLAPWTLVRNILEASAWAVWLLDPTIDVDERLGRGHSRRMKGLEEQGRFAKTTGRVEMLNHVKTRLAVAGRVATELAIPTIKVPGSTMIVQSMLQRGDVYSLLSGVVHGHHWALLEMGFGEAQPSPIDPKYERFGKELKPLIAVVAGIWAVKAVARAAQCVVRLLELDQRRFSALVDGFFDRPGMEPKGDRFWRYP